MRKTSRRADCVLCRPLKADQIYTTEHWRVLVNYNQNKLGKCLVVLMRHDEDICNLSDKEVRELWGIVRKLKAALCACFQPEHFNYAFLMNQDAHVHLHVIPRYFGSREFAGIAFQDSEAITGQKLSDRIHRQLVATLTEALDNG